MWIFRPALAFAFALSLAACGGKSGGPKPPGDEPPATLDLSLLGSACGDGGACPTGTACAKYYGIAGPSGPEFSSCEIGCSEDPACPDGSACITIADGPGAVCRPPAADEVTDEPTTAE